MKSTAVLISLLIAGLAQAQFYNFVTYKKDEIAAQFIYDIEQNQRGELFFATEEGLAIYDGISFDVLNTEDSLLFDFVSKVLIDSESTIWIAYNNGGMSKIQKDSLTHYPLTFNVLDMDDWGNGRVLVETDEGCFIFSDEGYSRFAPFDEVISLCAWEEGTVLTLDNNQQLNLRKTNGELHNIQSGVLQFSADIDQHLVGVITQNSLLLLKQNENEKFNIEQRIDLIELGLQQEITSIELSGNEILIGSADKGVVSILLNQNGEGYSSIHFSDTNGLISPNIRSLLIDKQGNRWIGTYGHGITYLPKNKIITYANQKNLARNNIKCLTYYQDQLYLGSEDGFYPFSKNGSSNPYLEGIIINALLATNDGLWIATNEQGLFHYEDEQLQPFIFEGIDYQPTTINCLAYADGKIYAGTNQGLYSHDFGTGTTEHQTTNDGLAHNVIEHITIDGLGRIWFDSPNSPIYNFDQNQFNYYQDLKEFESYNLSDIIELNDGRLVFGTNGDGIFIFENGHFAHYTTTNGLRSNFIDFIVQNTNGKIYIGHQNGLSIQTSSDTNLSFFNTPKIGQIRTINPSAALIHNHSDLWVGTPNGLVNLLNIKDFNQKSTVEIFITGLVVNNREIDPAHFELLDYGNYFMEFKFKTVIIGQEDEIEFEFILEGFDKDWTRIPGTKRQAIYQSLKDGDYIFKVRTLINGEVSGETKSLPFSVKSPYWKRPIFYFLLLILLLTIFIVIMSVVNRRNNKLRKKLAKKVQERTQEIKLKNEKIQQINTNLERISKEYLIAKELAERKTEEIEQSIRYAKHIQKVTYRKNEYIEWIKQFNDFYLIFKPKDIVSGDFYWGAKDDNYTFVAVGDCTGHGVPGALIGMLGVSILNDITALNKDTNVILNNLRSRIILELGQNKDDSNLYDGIDIGLIRFDDSNRMAQVSGAYSPVFIVRQKSNLKEEDLIHLKELDQTEDKVLLTTSPDKQPAGYHSNMSDFTAVEFQLYKGDQIYLFSDGFIDQFGGEKNKKFMRKRFVKILLEAYEMDGENQKEFIWTTLKDWKGTNEQVDDISLIGLKIK